MSYSLSDYDHYTNSKFKIQNSKSREQEGKQGRQWEKYLHDQSKIPSPLFRVRQSLMGEIPKTALTHQSKIQNLKSKIQNPQ